MKNGNSLSIVLDYILSHERDDFLEQCENNDMLEYEGLQKLDHVYAHAIRAEIALEKINELAASIVREVSE